jgi:hypothetical protein
LVPGRIRRAADAQGERRMTASQHDIGFSIDAPNLRTLFEQVLLRLFGAGADDAQDEATSFVAGFAAVAPEISSLLRTAAEDVAALVTEHGATARDISVSGVMSIDDGHRAWGFVTLIPQQETKGLSQRSSGMLREATVEQVTRHQWRAVVTNAGERGEV